MSWLLVYKADMDTHGLKCFTFSIAPMGTNGTAMGRKLVTRYKLSITVELPTV